MRRTLSRIVVISGAVIGMVAVAAGVQTARADAPEPPAPPVAPVAVPSAAAGRLAGAIRFPTVSTEHPSEFDGAAFSAMRAFLEDAFPRVHARLRREVIGAHSLLYTWPGRDASLPGILLAGHLDVVPVENGTSAGWTHGPFEGRVADGFVWGRGAIDNKSAVMGTLEAVDLLIGEGVVPGRTVYLAFGHDEEVGGTQGARRIAEVLERQGVKLELVIDEGGVVGQGVLAGLDGPVALVGIAEKGFVTVELSLRGSGGHSSLPPSETTVGIMSTAISKLERAQMPARLDGASQALFGAIGPRLPWAQRLAFSNLWLTSPFVLKSLERSPATNAMIRTTTAPTIFTAGTKDNVLPATARAVVNFRILPGDSVAAVLAHVNRVIGDPRITVSVSGRFSSEPSGVSSTESPAYRTLERAIQGVFPDAVVAPFLVVVVTDARYYNGISRDVYRFLPLRLTSADIARMHGADERIGIREYEDAIRAYRQLILDLAGRLP